MMEICGRNFALCFFRGAEFHTYKIFVKPHDGILNLVVFTESNIGISMKLNNNLINLI